VDLIERSDLSARRHPWEVARAGFFLRLLTRWGVAGPTRILDVGAGDAWFARQLVEILPGGAEVICWDVNYAADDLRNRDSLPDTGTTGAVSKVVLTADLPPGRFDGILMLDVIEHVEDDVSFVRRLVEESLVEGGWALISVPAYQGLFTAHDRALRHFRRYSPRQCRQIVRDAGLEVEWEGGLFHSLLALRAAKALRERAFGPGEHASEGIGAWRGGVRTTRLLTNVLDAEGRLALALGQRGFLVPGLSYWVCCRRATGALPSSSPVSSLPIAPPPPTP
jgi:SAM-dependent methyltransferase